MTTLSDALTAYRICAQAEGNSPKTIRWITSSVTYFSQFLGDIQDLTSITVHDFRRFVLALQERHKFARHPFNRPMPEKLSAHSINTYCRALRAFFGYLYHEGLIDKNPLEKVKMPKVPYKVVPTFSEKEVERLLLQPDKHTDRGFRDYALLLTFLDTAARLSEIAGLKEDDVDLENGYLRVMGKGNKERYIPFGQRVAKVLLKYRLKYRPQPLATDNFWLTDDGRPLMADRIEKIISTYGKTAHLNRCYAHKLRHTSAILYLRNGGDPFSLQKKLGHYSLTMTRHYANLADSDVRTRHLKYGVVDRLKV